jgi:hypothetical protein
MHPSLDPTTWSAIADPVSRLELAMAEVYAYYHQTEGMLPRAEQETPSNPILAEVLAPYADIWIQMHDTLLVGLVPEDEAEPLLTAAIGHALAFAGPGATDR